MGKIHILSQEVANIIAAGEVVKNPASLIKELIENSLDAKATKIGIFVSNNCRNIKIVDNGTGMSLEDLELSIQRHATSKISTKEDLFDLSTYGFRGEALSSIAAVSRMSLASKQDGDGYKILVEAGDLIGQEICALNRGTEVNVEDMFYNVPARLKFMRSEDNEFLKIKNIILKEALVNHNVSISLYLNNNLKLQTSGMGIENTILELFNANTLKNLNKFDLGFLGNTSLQKSSRDYIFTYFNNRYAKSHIVDKAILDSYYTKVDKGKSPFVILFLDLDPSEIDVNVHPSKEIVRFINEPAVYKYIKSKLSATLDLIDRNIVTNNFVVNNVNSNSEQARVNSETTSDTSTEVGKFSDSITINSAPDNLQRVNTTPYSNQIKSREYVNNTNIENSNVPFQKTEIEEIAKFKFMENQKLEEATSEDYFVKNRFIGQIFRSFSIVECQNRVELYDNHIVQERILYEEIKDYYYNKKIIKQNLLVPIKIKFNKIDKMNALNNADFLNSFGFEIEDFEGDDILIRTVPLFKLHDSYENIFKDLVEKFNYKIKDEMLDIREEAIITMSCRKSIKAGDNVSDEEMKAIINKLHKLKRYSCPHGRNIITDISRLDIDKLFKR